MRAVAVIPARLGSTRLPAKVLADLGGKPVVRRVWENCVASGVFSRVVIATDHDSVLRAAASFGAEAVLTDPGLASGTERVAEVARSLVEEVVVNVQGDEPFLAGEVFVPLVGASFEDGVRIATPVTPVRSADELADPATVKVVLDARREARCFSRWPVPFLRDGWTPGDPWTAVSRTPAELLGRWWRHLGVYAFRRETLLEVVGLPPAPAESMEKLEQLRWLHHGVPVRCVPVEAGGISIDTVEDLDRARRMVGD